MRGEKMKGIFVGTVLLIAILTLIISGVFFVVLSSEYINLKISLKASEVLKAADIVEAVKRGLEVAYNYSFLQAAYEVGKLGGYSNESDVKEWRRYDATYFPNSYIENIRLKMENYVEEYLKALEEEMSGFKFRKPSINFLLPENQGKDIKIIVSFDSPFRYSGNFFTIYDNPNRTLYISSDFEYFKLYDTAYNLFIDKDTVRERINVAENKMDDKCRLIYLGDVCEEYKIDVETKLEENCPNADEKFKEKVIQEIEKPISNDVNVNLYVDKDKIEVKRKSREIYDSFQESSDCGCKIIDWLQVDNGTTTCDEYCTSNNYEYSKFDNSQCFCGNCKEYYKKYYNLKYEYNYFSAVRVIANITTKSQYLAYDAMEGNVKLRNFTLTFNLTTSNDYSWKPI
jgi:hypothetical protein